MQLDSIQSACCSPGQPGEIPGRHARADLGLPGHTGLPGSGAAPGASLRRAQLPHAQRAARDGRAALPANRAPLAQHAEVQVPSTIVSS